jgi:hypothetical protein
MYHFVDVTGRHFRNVGAGGPGLSELFEKADQSALDAINALAALQVKP